MTAVLKVLVVLEAILQVVVEDLEMRCLSFLIREFLYCRNVFSLLLKIMYCRSVKVGSSSFCCRDVLVFAVSVWRWLILVFVHLILLWMSEHSAFFIIACSKLLKDQIDQHKRQLTLHTFLISICNRSVIPMFTSFKLQDN